MRLHGGMGVCLLLAGVVSAGDTGASSDDVVRRVYTVAVDSRTGKLVRVPASRFSRPVLARTVPERVIRPIEVSSEPSAPSAGPAYNVASGRPFDQLIAQVASRYQIRPSFVHAVIKAESNYNPRAISSKGALGLMQLMPQTARRFGVKNVFDPTENVEGGVRYLRFLLDLYNDHRLSLAAYNAGEGAVERFGGVPPYLETRQFVERAKRHYDFYRSKESLLDPAAAPKKWEGPRIYQLVDASGTVRYTTEAP